MSDAAGITLRDRRLGGLWGSLVGDALGVPVEFEDRATVQADPVTDMREYGTHRQPRGTWSDDSSLLLCTADSLVRHPFDTTDMGKRFVSWYQEELWMPHGKVFDVGVATAQALTRIATGARAEVAGNADEFSNGNGSLMRILPVSLRFAEAATNQLLDKVHRASAITHRHPRSQMACGLLTLCLRELLQGASPAQAFQNAWASFLTYYKTDNWWGIEFDQFQLRLAENLAGRDEAEIASDGYVMNTLQASLWCLLTTANFSDCVLKAVNLGGDTDTTGCVAGGLAGVAYGLKSIPTDWIHQLARRSEVERLFHEFLEVCEHV